MKEAAGIILYHDGSDFFARGGGEPRFLLLRNRVRGEWGFAKGHRDPSDTDLLTTAAREVREEVGFRDVLLHTGFRKLVEYELPSGGIKQVTYFLGLAPFMEVSLSDEHDQSTWLPIHDALELLEHGNLCDLLTSASAFLRQSEPLSDLL